MPGKNEKSVFTPVESAMKLIYAGLCAENDRKSSFQITGGPVKLV